MYKLMTLGTLLLGLALAPLLGGTAAVDEQGAQAVPSARQLDARATSEQGVAPVAASRGCEWQCQACEPEQGCSQICAEIGDCGSACDMIAQCDADRSWDESSCSCR